MTREGIGGRRRRGSTARALLTALLLAPLLALATVTATSATAGAEPVGTVELFEVEGIDGPMSDFTAGPDGSTWFVARSDHAIGRVAADGEVTTFTGPDIGLPVDLVAGPDGNLWFADEYVAAHDRGAASRITPSGVVTRFAAEDVFSPGSITSGPDGDLWFVDNDLFWGTRFFSISTSGAIAPVASIGDDDGAGELTNRPDGNIWFPTPNGVGFITPEGDATLTDRTSEFRFVQSVRYGVDGSAWAVDPDRGSIVRYTADDLTYPTIFNDPAYGSPEHLAVGVDSSAWFIGSDPVVRRITAGGELTSHPTPGMAPTAIAAGPDGGIWIADDDGIGRLGLDGSFTPVAVAGGLDGRGIEPVGDHIWFQRPGLVGRVAATTGAVPTHVSATIDRRVATISWQAPLHPADPVVTGYQVVASPGGATCSTAGARSCSIAGLTVGVATTFTVRAVGVSGAGAASAASNAVLPWDGAGFHPVAPARILDSRAVGVGFSGRVVAGTPRRLQVTGLGGASEVPTSASAVVLNVTVTDSNAESFLTVHPAGGSTPNASNLNFGPGQVIANLVTVKLGAGGRVDLATAVGSTNVVADVAGYYDDGAPGGDLFTPMTPVRLLDSRVDNPWIDVVSAQAQPSRMPVTRPAEPLPWNDPIEDHPDGVPYRATAIVANVTVTNATEPSFVKLWPASASEPGVSNLNFAAGQTIANLVVLDVGETGEIEVANAVGDVDVIVDVVGYFQPLGGSRFHAMDPNRVLDTRFGPGPTGKVGAGQARALPVAGAAGTNVPAGATGLVANVTVADATAESFVAVFPGDMARPDPFSNVNFGINQVIPNLSTVGLAADGSAEIYNHLGQTHVIADAVGWYAPW